LIIDLMNLIINYSINAGVFVRRSTFRRLRTQCDAALIFVYRVMVIVCESSAEGAAMVMRPEVAS
jgi:hypothetical protein